MALRASSLQAGGGNDVQSVTGTANEVTASPTTGAVIVGLPDQVAINGATVGSYNLAVNGNVKFTYSDAVTSSFEPYAFGTKYTQTSAAVTTDNRLELYLGTAATNAAELSVRHNGNNTGAIIQARNAGDTDGMFLDFTNSTYPWVRWGNDGPYLTKEGAGILVMRNMSTLTQAQVLRIANTYTPGDVREYLQLGYSSNNAIVRTTGVGGGTQRPLIVDASVHTIQTASTNRWAVDANGVLQSTSSTSTLLHRNAISAKTSGYSPAVNDSGSVYTNEGAGGSVTATLPATAAGLRYTFQVIAAQDHVVDAPAGTTMYAGASATTSGGTLTSNTVGSSITLIAINATTYIAESVTGTWVAA